MIIRRFGWLLVALAVLAGVLILTLALVNRENAVQRDLKLCQAIDHFVQLQEFQVASSPVLTDDEKQVRVAVFENFRDEIDCRDQLDPDVIRDAIRENGVP